MKLRALVSFAQILLFGDAYEFGTIVAHFGDFQLYRLAIITRGGRRKMLPYYYVIVGDLETPFRVPIRRSVNQDGSVSGGARTGNSIQSALNLRGCVDLGEMDVSAASITVVDVYYHVHTWLRDRQTLIDFFGNQPSNNAGSPVNDQKRQESRQRLAEKMKLQYQMVDEALQALTTIYRDELVTVTRDVEADQKQTDRLWRRLRWLRL